MTGVPEKKSCSSPLVCGYASIVIDLILVVVGFVGPKLLSDYKTAGLCKKLCVPLPDTPVYEMDNFLFNSNKTTRLRL